MARIIRYTKGDLSLRDQVIGTDAENQNATVNIPIAAIIDLAIDYFSTNGNGDGINQSLLDITTSVDGLTTAVATYTNTINTNTSEIEAIVTRTETLESTFETNEDGTLTISAANITNFAETIASYGFASATTLNTLSTKVQQIVDGELVIDTYATIEQLANTTSTLEGSIATLQDTLTTGYQNYADGIIQTDAFSQAVSGLVTEANGEFASATDFTNLQAQFGTFDADGNLTGLSTALANQVTTTISGEGYATTSSLNALEASLTTYVNDQILSSSTAGITGEQLATTLEGYAEATELTAFKAEVGTFDEDGNLISLSTALADKVTQTIATENYATSSDVTALESTVNGNTATLTQTASTVSDITGRLQSSYGLNLTAGNAVAGMTFLADGETELSEIKFVANTFKIDRPGGAISPFIVNADGTISLNGQVTFTSASTGDGIGYDALQQYLDQYNYATTSDIPAAFTDADVQAYLDAQGYVAGQNALDDAQIATYLSENNYVTTSTTINGGQIQTGIIASGDYADSTPNDGFSDRGMAINLDSGSIHSEQFYINPDGTANFGGIHSAGSIGSWTVDSSGALKDSSSEIVLDPSGNYTEVGTEKLVLSSEDLPPISPNAAVNMEFLDLAQNGSLAQYFEELSERRKESYSQGQLTGESEINGSNNDGRLYKFTFDNITQTLDAITEDNNQSYQGWSGSTFSFQIPYYENIYGLGSLVLHVQEKFARDYGWAVLPEQEQDPQNPYIDCNPELNPNAAPSVDNVFTFDYKAELHVYFELVKHTGPSEEFRREITLAEGSSSMNLNELSYDGISTTPMSVRACDRFVGATVSAGDSWEAGVVEDSYTPDYNDPSLYTGEIRVRAEYVYEVTNINLWAASADVSGYVGNNGDYISYQTTRLDGSAMPWAFIQGGGGSYYSNGSPIKLASVLFTGAQPKTNIGLNGIQVRGDKGFVVMGDAVASDAVFQTWGDAQIIGRITVNAFQNFSDKNLKHNIKPISNALDTISKLAPVKFKWYPDVAGSLPGDKYGFIAQDVQEVLPSIVNEQEYLTIEQNNIISINTAAIQELINKINKLEEEIKTLKENNG
jgi:hypothetical protein